MLEGLPYVAILLLLLLLVLFLILLFIFLFLLLPRQECFASLHILTRRASEGSEALPSLARRVSMSFFGARVICASRLSTRQSKVDGTLDARQSPRHRNQVHPSFR